ncbi:MAG: minor capsid protein [Porphyromonas sp.]|nr:minor capsid protein [Porphyromonas sp.]
MQGLQSELSRIRSPFLLAAAIRRYARSPTYRQAAVILARSMVTHVFSDGHKTWREAARAGSKGAAIYKALQDDIAKARISEAYQELINRNAELIKTMPLNIAEQVTNMVSRQSQGGLRSAEIMRDVLAAYPRMTHAHARLIARTESSKAATTLTQVRSEAAGVKWYEWRTGEDQRVRDSHRLMNGVLIRWSDPPNPELLNREKHAHNRYHAGNIYNCRCFPAPLVQLSDVNWPHKVYYAGRIQTMTLAQFKKIGGDV